MARAAVAPANDDHEEVRPKRQRVILTAEEWQKKLAGFDSRANREQREFEDKLSYELSVEDLRDECVAIIRNELGRGEGVFEIVHGRMGPHPSTLHNWENKVVKRPQLSKMRAALRAVRHDFRIVPISGDRRH